MNTEVLNKITWGVDPTHSEVTFKVKHLVISTVSGTFNNFDGSFESENEDFDNADVNFTIDVDSIDTKVADRDNHLKSDDFFSVANYPEIKFLGKLVKSGSDYSLVGDITVKDITKNVTLDVDFGGVMVDPYGQTKAGFEVNGKLNRKEFGLTWDAITEAGGVVVGEDIKLDINVQFVMQA